MRRKPYVYYLDIVFHNKKAARDYYERARKTGISAGCFPNDGPRGDATDKRKGATVRLWIDTLPEGLPPFE